MRLFVSSLRISRKQLLHYFVRHFIFRFILGQKLRSSHQLKSLNDLSLRNYLVASEQLFLRREKGTVLKIVHVRELSHRNHTFFSINLCLLLPKKKNCRYCFRTRNIRNLERKERKGMLVASHVISSTVTINNFPST